MGHEIPVSVETLKNNVFHELRNSLDIEFKSSFVHFITWPLNASIQSLKKIKNSKDNNTTDSFLPETNHLDVNNF